MIVLTPRFALLSVLASLAAISLAPPADAAAIAIRGHPSQSSSAVNSYASAHASNVMHPSGNSQDVHPVIPLPARLASQEANSSGNEPQKSEKKKGKKDKKRPKRFDSWGSNLVIRYQDDGLPPLLQSRALHDGATTHHEPDVAIDGLNDHVEFGRSPDPHHHHHHHHHHHGDVDKVIIKGNNDNVHLGRSPEPHHHHHHADHIDKVIVKGNNDNVHFNRSPEPHHHHHHHNHHEHGDKVVVKGNNDNVHVGRSPEPHHHHHHHHHHHGDHVDKVIVKGNNDNVHVGRSPEPHHHHHGDHVDKVIVKGNNDNVHLKDKRGVYINDVQSNESYIVTHTSRSPGHQRRKVVRVIGDNFDVSKMRRAEAFMEGVPGTVDIMSQVIHQLSGTRIASLVLVHPDDSMASSVDVNATWILNASEKNFTQVYLVPVTPDGIATNATSKTEAGDIPVSLKVPVFDPDSASMVSYCATFDPNPPAPAPLTAEPCFSRDSTPLRKSQVFQYTPASGVLSPTWFKGEDDGTNDGSNDGAPEDPRTPQDAGAASITDVGEADTFKSSSGDFGNATAPASSSDNGATNSTTNDASPQDGLRARAQNVTMIFSPAIPASLSSLKSDSGAASPLANNSSAPTTVGGLNTTDGGNRSSEGSTTTASSGSTTPSQQSAEELNVMVGVAREEGTSGTLGSADPVMTPVSTAPYEWRFSRERS